LRNAPTGKAGASSGRVYSGDYPPLTTARVFLRTILLHHLAITPSARPSYFAFHPRKPSEHPRWDVVPAEIDIQKKGYGYQSKSGDKRSAQSKNNHCSTLRDVIVICDADNIRSHLLVAYQSRQRAEENPDNLRKIESYRSYLIVGNQNSVPSVNLQARN
jgi:hypothetical protein